MEIGLVSWSKSKREQAAELYMESAFFWKVRRYAEAEREWSENDKFWWATITGDTGQSDNVRWDHDENVYSFTGLTKELLHELVERDRDEALNGYKYWCLSEFDGRTLTSVIVIPWVKTEEARVLSRRFRWWSEVTHIRLVYSLVVVLLLAWGELLPSDRYSMTMSPIRELVEGPATEGPQ